MLFRSGRDSAFQQLPQSCDLLGFGFAHARSLLAAFLIVNGRNLILRFQLADIGPINPVLPAVAARCSAKDHRCVGPALWRHSLTVEPRGSVRVWRPLRAVADWALTHPHIDDNTIASLRSYGPPCLFACGHNFTSVLRFTRRCRFFSVASLTSGTLHPRTEPRTRQATEEIGRAHV